MPGPCSEAFRSSVLETFALPPTDLEHSGLPPPSARGQQQQCTPLHRRPPSPSQGPPSARGGLAEDAGGAAEPAGPGPRRQPSLPLSYGRRPEQRGGAARRSALRASIGQSMLWLWDGVSEENLELFPYDWRESGGGLGASGPRGGARGGALPGAAPDTYSPFKPLGTAASRQFS